MSANRPNIVLMLSDNIGYGDIGAFQGGEIRGVPTPNIDSIADDGVTLTQCLVEAACTPSRAALLTGRYSPRSGLGSVIIGGTPNTLTSDEITIAVLLSDSGYSTAMAGKWHLGSEEQSWPTNQGFDEYRVGVIETSDSTLYRQQMERLGFDEDKIVATAPSIWEGDKENGLERVREYTVDYRSRVEDDIAAFGAGYVAAHAADEAPFFLYLGWTQTHYPNVTSPEFAGKSRIGMYGDGLLQHDHCVGQVLDAINNAGIEDDTIVVYLSDNGATPLSGPAAYRGGSNGMYTGELGDGREGSIRAPGMIKWPGNIPARKSNEMFSIHDVFTTLAAFAGVQVPQDRPIDGFDQSDFLLGKQEHSNRESHLTFISDEIVAVRWRQYRFYPKSFVSSTASQNTPGLCGNRLESNGYPDIYHIERDPAEQENMIAYAAWAIPAYIGAVTEYLKSLEEHPNPPAINLTKFDYPEPEKIERFTGSI